MATVITPYAINSIDSVAYEISAVATPIMVGVKDSVPTVWYSADPLAEDLEVKTFAIFQDGAEVSGTYVGSYLYGNTAYHIYVTVPA